MGDAFARISLSMCVPCGCMTEIRSRIEKSECVYERAVDGDDDDKIRSQ